MNILLLPNSWSMKKIILLMLLSVFSFQSYAGESFPELSKALRLFVAGKMKKEKVMALIEKSELAVKVRDLEITTVHGVKTVRWHMVNPMDQAIFTAKNK